jgi:methylmalonyl-CoA mutase N-terminal domain/subunit
MCTMPAARLSPGPPLDVGASLTPVGQDTQHERATESGIPLERVYDAASLAGLDLDARLGEPGEYPFTRGVHSAMYRDRPWTMRQYAGFATAEETNERFRYLLAHGAPGLSMAFDLPTQLGMDSDDPRALGEVGRVGVAIDSIDDMARVFEGIDPIAVSTSMTINAPAACLLLLYQLVAEEKGADTRELRGTIQNDVLKEYVARGNYIFPPTQSMRLTVDTFAYCRTELPNWNTISISGYHIREAGSTAVQEIAFTLANGIAYVQAAIDAGLAVDEFGPRLSFFFNAHNNLLEEVAKFRAARRMWARIMRDRFGATNDRAMMLRFHAQTGGSTLTAQQPENNIVRVAVQVLAAALGGAQSIHANGFDEALALPTERAAKLALRTQQTIAAESGITDTVDPFGGSWAVEALTAELEQRADSLISQIDERGGAVQCIELMQQQIHDSAYRHQQEVTAGTRKIVGINTHVEADEVNPEILRIDPEIERAQVARLADLRERRDAGQVTEALTAVHTAATGSDNLLYPIREALRARATIGEVCGVLRETWGEYDRLRSAH